MKEVESPILRENKRQCRHPWPLGMSHCQQQFWSKCPTQDLPQRVLCYGNSCVTFPLSPMGSPTTPGCPRAWDLQGQQGREKSAWCPRNWFGLSDWFTEPSGLRMREKGTNTRPAQPQRMASCLIKWHQLCYPSTRIGSRGY